MKLFIIRHGEAAPSQGNDSLRALTVKGAADAKALGEMLARECLQPDIAITSPYVRARQTLDNLLQAFQQKPLTHVAERITPEDPVRTAYAELGVFAEHEVVLVVSHMPLVSSLVASLVDGTAATSSHYPMMPASVAELDVDVLAPGGARLRRLLSPPYA